MVEFVYLTPEKAQDLWLCRTVGFRFMILVSNAFIRIVQLRSRCAWPQVAEWRAQFCGWTACPERMSVKIKPLLRHLKYEVLPEQIYFTWPTCLYSRSTCPWAQGFSLQFIGEYLYCTRWAWYGSAVMVILNFLRQHSVIVFPT